LVAWVGSRIELGDAWSVLHGAPWWVFAVPVVLMLANATIHALRISLLLDAMGAPVSVPRVLGALLKSWFLGFALPRGGSDIAKIGFISSESGSMPAALAALAAARVIELVPWLLLLFYGLAWGLVDVAPHLAATAAVFAVPFTGVLLVSALALWRGQPVGPWLEARVAGERRARWGWLARMLLRVGTFVDHLVGLRRRPGTLVAVLLLAFPFAVVHGLVVWAVARGFGIQVPLMDLFALVPAADLLISLPLTVSGLGVREALFAEMFGPYGASATVGVAIGLTRWTGELGRAVVGGMVFLLQRGAVPQT
jgi:uncharacterized membrane protein YbhN (UPF0104 family)